MKILHLAKRYLPHLGGVEIHLKEINSLLVKLGHEVTVITQQHDLKLAKTATYDGVKVIRIPKNFSDKKMLTWKFMIEHKDIFIDADIIHVHDVFWWVLSIPREVKNKVFITFHGWETKFPVSFTAKLQRFLYSKMAGGSIHIGSWIQNFYWDKPDFVSFGAINAKRFTRSGKKIGQIRITSGKGACDKADNNIVSGAGNKKIINLTFVGRLSKDNSVDQYIELLKLLKLRNKKIKFNIIWVGDGELRSKCEKLGEVTGFVKNVSKYLVSRDLVFASSYLSILEAQLLKNNVCAFYSNKLKKAYLESFPGSKYMLIAGDVTAMIKKISFLLSAPKLKKVAAEDARKFAKSQSWDKVLKIYLKLWGVAES